jgi:hypothetical protein
MRVRFTLALFFFALVLLAMPAAASANWLQGGARPEPVAATPSQVLRVATASPRGKIDTADPWTARANALEPAVRVTLDATDPWSSSPLVSPEALVTRRNRSVNEAEAWAPLPLPVATEMVPSVNRVSTHTRPLLSAGRWVAVNEPL